jgi:hypothetical protein
VKIRYIINKGFLKYKSAKMQKLAQETLEKLQLDYMEDNE